MHEHTYKFTHSLTACTHTHTHTHTHTQTHMCTHPRTHARTHILIHTLTHARAAQGMQASTQGLANVRPMGCWGKVQVSERQEKLGVKGVGDDGGPRPLKFCPALLSCPSLVRNFRNTLCGISGQFPVPPTCRGKRFPTRFPTSRNTHTHTHTHIHTHTASVGAFVPCGVCVCVCVCGCFDDLANSQHAQHGAQLYSHSRGGHIVHALPFLIATPENCLGGSAGAPVVLN